jgi:hypothetical protein
MRLVDMARGGRPFRADEHSDIVWRHMGMAAEALEEIRNRNHQQELAAIILKMAGYR